MSHPEALEEVHGQPSWRLVGDQVELAVTQFGGHMAPVTFFPRSERPIRPYYVSPWQEERLPADRFPAAVLRPLRGDFFCLPFGGNAEPLAEERHVPHGETATAAWQFGSRSRQSDGSEELTLHLETRIRPGRVTKQIVLRPGEPVVYTRHRIEGFAGPAPLGHHATLALPARSGALTVTVSPFRCGLTNPALFSDPAAGEYQSLAIAAAFTDLTRVPTMFKQPPDTDCTRFPCRPGYADLLAVAADATALGGEPAWTTAVQADEQWAWFSLRDPAVLPLTLFWIEDRGRHGSPWNGRNRCLGLEDVCGHFADGLAASVRPNVLSAQGIPTAVELAVDRPTEIRYLQGAVRVPPGFERVATIEFEADGIRLCDPVGVSVSVPVHHRFVMP